MDELNTKIGKLVTQARVNAKMSQATLGERVGLTRTSITNLETGRQGDISVVTVWKIAAALNIPPECLLPIGDTPIPERPARTYYKRVEPQRTWLQQLAIKLFRLED